MADTTVAYVDDSGDHRAAVLAAVLVPASRWLEVHDRLVEFRRRTTKRLGFRMAREFKATEIVSNGGPWRALRVAPRTRLGLFLAAMAEFSELAPVVRTIAVVLPNRDDDRLTRPATEIVWRVMLERLQTFSVKNDTTCVLVPDEGASATVRKLARRHRRFNYVPAAYGPSGAGTGLAVPVRQLVDDPFHRDSRDSYLIQWTDLVAYAAFREVLSIPGFPPNMWDTLGEAFARGELDRASEGIEGAARHHRLAITDAAREAALKETRVTA